MTRSLNPQKINNCYGQFGIELKYICQLSDSLTEGGPFQKVWYTLSPNSGRVFECYIWYSHVGIWLKVSSLNVKVQQRIPFVFHLFKHIVQKVQISS
jgi:hypothetical protein